MINEELSRRLVEVSEQVARLAKLRRRLAESEARHRGAVVAADHYQDRLAKEERDVKRLEGTSIAGLLASLAGTKDERLRKERQEAVAARIRHDDACRRRDDAAAELQRCKLEIASLAGVEVIYETLLAHKERAIGQGPDAEQLQLIADGLQAAELRRKELAEAHGAGRDAAAALDLVLASLDTARKWGIGDIIGGGFIVTAVKHDHINKARERLAQAQQAISRFKRELKDVTHSVHMPRALEMDGFIRVADYLFDNVFVDIFVQQQIHKSIEAVEKTKDQLDGLLKWVDLELAGVNDELQDLEDQKQLYIEAYR